MTSSFNDEERRTIYRVIESRRDIREFLPEQVPSDVLLRVLDAAHHAPSVGFMQPWNFIVISSRQVRSLVKASFEQANSDALSQLNETERADLYRKFKLEGILESPINLAVTCDHRRDSPFVLGRQSMPETDLYSTCLAIQNLWLAARAEGIGVGWVSIIDREEVERILGLPQEVQLVAYMCIGYPKEFRPRPMLEEVGWKTRYDLSSVIYHDIWGEPLV